LFFLGKFNQRFAQTLPSHSILLGSVVMAMLPVPNKSETGQRPKCDSATNWPPEISAVKLQCNDSKCCHNAYFLILFINDESCTEAADNCCDD
jgi:hypothetical protein